MDNFKTPKGTILPLLDLKGKKYLQVAHRIHWFREEHPLGLLEGECIEKTEKYVIYKGSVSVWIDGKHVKLADAYKREDFSHFSDAHEKCNTGAIGRALAMCGYGTQFCSDDFEEGQRLADAPASFSRSIQKDIGKIGNSEDFMEGPGGDPGAYTMTFGKFRGKTLAEIGAHDIESYASWMKSEAKKKNEPPNAIAQEALDAIEAFVKTRERKLGTQRDIFE